ncbi:MAG: DUF1150 domain-containing protein [Hyphomicrobiaceae bacterium]|nr:DUF1150 domain-containing protein [Hyphomicrobiaceae bacterium]
MNHESEKARRFEPLAPELLARLGTGEVAYLRAITPEGIRVMFPQAPQMPDGARFWSLHAADGTPILLADSRELALAQASAADLVTVAVH